MAVFEGAVSAGLATLAYYVADATDGIGAPAAYERVATQAPTFSDTLGAENLLFLENRTAGPALDFTNNASFDALFQDVAQPDWFEDIHVVPRLLALGNVLSDQTIPTIVFSAFRRETKSWASFTNNAGVGVTLVGDPPLPSDVAPMSGVAMNIEISTNGPAFIDSTMVYVFTGVGTITVPITLQRIVLWGHEPELPYNEHFRFRTNIYPAKTGPEKRDSVRKNPRQSFDYRFVFEEGVQAATFENLLFDFQGLTFGVPVWEYDSSITAAVSAGALTITVDATAFRDYRVGGLAVIFTSQATRDVLEIASITATTITFTTATVNAYAIGTLVFPMGPSRATQVVSGSRFINGLRTTSISFAVVDNDVTLANTAPFSSYKSKVLLDNGNTVLSATLSHSYEAALEVIDGGAGLIDQQPLWDRHKRKTLITIRALGKQAKWELRGLLAALDGPRVSFYMPTSAKDLVPVADLLVATATMDVTNVGYTQFVRRRLGKLDIRINFVDGSTPLTREITISTVISSTVEQITVDSNWPSTITPAQISSIEYLEKIRFDSDDLVMQHVTGDRAYLLAPIKTLFE